MNHTNTVEFRADNGLPVRLRPMKPSDIPYLLDLFRHMSSESRYLRFNIPLNDPDPDWLEQQAAIMAAIDAAEGRGWLAFADLPGQPDTCVGGIRLIWGEDRETAEVALSVRDDLHGEGIGTSMLRWVAHVAYEEGVRTLIGVAQSRNTPLWHSLQRLDVPLRRKRDGSYTQIEIDLERVLALEAERSPSEFTPPE
ncbi:MAG: GNAT family protein [Candidatus Promineifilaceae bacterium]|nr:GNAT family protein [Candidatus Promineifilaceae bacterium]